MLIANIKFLIIIGILLISAISFFVWVCVTGKSEYQKMLDREKREKKEYQRWFKRVRKEGKY